jgi:Fe-S cluster assembly protein SufD
VNSSFSPDVVASAEYLPARSNRVQAAAAAAEQDLPTAEAEEWRYSPIGELDIGDLRPVLQQPVDSDISPPAVVSDPAATVVMVDGFVVSTTVAAGWEAKGLRVEVDPGRYSTVESRAATVFDNLHVAFSPGAVVIAVPAGLALDAPIVVVNHHHTVNGASFPHLVIDADEDSEVQVVEWQTSGPGHGLSVPVVELATAPAARLGFLTVQHTSAHHWLVARQQSQADRQSSLSAGIAYFGGRYARLRTDCRLVGRGASTNLTAAYYGDGRQVHDFRTFLHHEARDTRSDMLFKGAQDDVSGSIYTGMIHIHPDGAGSNAFQTNRNIKLSEDAWAWSVPNLEIENNEVHCSHASTVSPIEEDQRFYLHARGVPPKVADRLIVAGFYDEVLNRLPVAPARAEVRKFIAEKLDRRTDSHSATAGAVAP